jgi:hypothetical protein
MNTKPEHEELEWIRRSASIKADVETVRQSFAGEVAKNGVAYAIEWAESQVIDELVAERWSLVSSKESDGDWLDALIYAVDAAHRMLIENLERPSSSSPFHNAVKIAQREAVSRFYRDGAAMLDHLRSKNMLDRCPSCSCYFIEQPTSDDCPVPEQHAAVSVLQHGTSTREAN